MDDKIKQALATDEVIDITTTGRKSGQHRRIEIWFKQVDGRTYITGTPGPRDWYANLLANPNLIFHLKESVQADLPARARFVLNPDERLAIFSDPAMAWYRKQVESVDELLTDSPLIEVIFTEQK